MAISADDLPTYTDADLLKIYRWALANNAAGQTRNIAGRSITFPTAPQIRETITWLENRVQAAADVGSGASAGVSVVTFDDPM